MAEQSGDVGTELLFENRYVKVWNLVLEAGQASSWHLHTLDYMYIVIEPGKVRTEYKDGTYEQQEDAAGDVVMRAQDAIHRLVNLGKSRYRNIVIELKG